MILTHLYCYNILFVRLMLPPRLVGFFQQVNLLPAYNHQANQEIASRLFWLLVNKPV